MMAGLRLYWLSLSIVATAWLLDFSFLPRSPPIYNYDSEVFFDPNMYYTPRSKSELADLLQALSSSNKHGNARRVRAVGAGHSWSAVAQSDEIQVSMSNFKGMVSVDKDTMQATFGAGTTFHEVNAILDDLGLALPVLGSISDQTVAGAISTGTHGSGIKYGNMASYVTKLELVTGNGEIITLHSNDSADPSLFSAAQVSLGLLGIITEVTFQYVPAFNLEETCVVSSLSDCLDNMDNLINSADHVKLWIEIYSDMCTVIASNRTEEEPRDNPSPLVGLIVNVITEVVLTGISWFPKIIPSAISFLTKYGGSIKPYNRVDVSHRVFNIPHYFPHHQETEVVVHVDQCGQAIRELQKFVYEEGIPLNYITEVRFVRADSIPLSPDFQRDSCHITLCIANPSEYDKERYFIGFYKNLVEKGLSPRVHWGKSFSLAPDDIKAMYPSLPHFLNVRNKFDEQNLFMNKLLSESFVL